MIVPTPELPLLARSFMNKRGMLVGSKPAEETALAAEYVVDVPLVFWGSRFAAM